MKILILGATLLAGPAAAQCTAFVASPTIALFIDDAGKTRHPGIRNAPVILMPALKLAFKVVPQVKIKDELTVSEIAACFAPDFKRNEKSGLMKFWMENAGGTFTPVWGRESELKAFTFEVAGLFQDQSGFENMGKVRHALELVLDRERNADFKPPEIENQRTFPEDFDKVWSALVETLSDQQWSLETIDKASGLVTTKTLTDSRGDTMVCATKFDEAHRTSLSLFVKKSEAGTRVKVNATFRAVREDAVIRCFSSGGIEKLLFDGIKKNL